MTEKYILMPFLAIPNASINEKLRKEEKILQLDDIKTGEPFIAVKEEDFEFVEGILKGLSLGNLKLIKEVQSVDCLFKEYTAGIYNSPKV